MADKAALYLGHLNPMTRAHEIIISNLKRDYSSVYVFPVRFVKAKREINTKSFPFSYAVRKEMVESVFGSSVNVLPDYAFESPYSKYLPPLLSRRSWKLRNQIVSRIAESEFVSYTGDKIERLMLKAYGLHPLTRSRLELTATSVREKLYAAAVTKDKQEWRDLVPTKVADIIEDNWFIVETFGNTSDQTKRVLGMKFPLDGYADIE